MVDAHGGRQYVTGKPSATGAGVHLIFQYESPKPTASPRHPPSIRAPPKDVEMVDESESESRSSSDSDMDSSESSSSSDADTVEPNIPYNGQRLALPLWMPKPRRTEDLQPEDCQEGMCHVHRQERY